MASLDPSAWRARRATFSGSSSSSNSPGALRIVKSGEITGTFLTVPPVLNGNEQGLLSIAFHPQFATNRKFYVYYVKSAVTMGFNSQCVLAEYHASASDPDVADTDPASTRILLQFDHPQSNHNAGWLAFGPDDGYLYLSIGDGGGGGDGTDGSSNHTAGTGNAQDITNNLLGKILRLDVDGADAFPADANKNYAIPAGNPFNGVNGDREIWAYGLRNPWRPCFDRLTGDLYIADVGQDLWEEVDFARAAGRRAQLRMEG